MTRDIAVQVAITTFPDSKVIEVKTSGGDEHNRADVTELILLHLDGLWAELADRIKAVELPDISHCHHGLDA